MPSIEQKKIRNLFALLKNAEHHLFPPKKGVDAPEKQGVYLILSPKSKKVLHVGSTYRGAKGLRQRLNNHIYGGSSFTARYLDHKGSRLRGRYWFSYLEVRSPRHRALLEAHAAGMLCPAHIGLNKALEKKTNKKGARK